MIISLTIDYSFPSPGLLDTKRHNKLLSSKRYNNLRGSKQYNQQLIFQLSHLWLGRPPAKNLLSSLPNDYPNHLAFGFAHDQDTSVIAASMASPITRSTVPSTASPTTCHLLSFPTAASRDRAAFKESTETTFKRTQLE